MEYGQGKRKPGEASGTFEQVKKRPGETAGESERLLSMLRFQNVNDRESPRRKLEIKLNLNK